MYTNVEELKKALEANGFSSVKFPGGGGNLREHSSIGILWDVLTNEKNVVLCMLVLPFRHVPPEQRIMISEANTLGEEPRETVSREIFEETSIEIAPDKFQECCTIDFGTHESQNIPKKYFYSSRTSLEFYKESCVTQDEVELGCGYPIVVDVETLISFLADKTDRTTMYAKAGLRRALEKKILFTPGTRAISKTYYWLLGKLPVEETIYNKFSPSQ